MKPFLTALVLAVVLTPTLASPMERNGAVLIFSFEDLRKILLHPAPQQFMLPFSWQSQKEKERGSRSANISGKTVLTLTVFLFQQHYTAHCGAIKPNELRFPFSGNRSSL